MNTLMVSPHIVNGRYLKNNIDDVKSSINTKYISPQVSNSVGKIDVSFTKAEDSFEISDHRTRNRHGISTELQTKWKQDHIDLIAFLRNNFEQKGLPTISSDFTTLIIDHSKRHSGRVREHMSGDLGFMSGESVEEILLPYNERSDVKALNELSYSSNNTHLDVAKIKEVTYKYIQSSLSQTVEAAKSAIEKISERRLVEGVTSDKDLAFVNMSFSLSPSDIIEGLKNVLNGHISGAFMVPANTFAVQNLEKLNDSYKEIYRTLGLDITSEEFRNSGLFPHSNVSEITSRIIWTELDKILQNDPNISSIKEEFSNVLKTAERENIMFFKSSGNDLDDEAANWNIELSKGFLSDVDELNVVGANHTYSPEGLLDDKVTHFSSIGADFSLSGPRGTSYSTPLAVSVAGLLATAYNESHIGLKHLNAKDIKDILMNPQLYNYTIGADGLGSLNILKAVEYAQNWDEHKADVPAEISDESQELLNRLKTLFPGSAF